MISSVLALITSGFAMLFVGGGILYATYYIMARYQIDIAYDNGRLWRLSFIVSLLILFYVMALRVYGFRLVSLGLNLFRATPALVISSDGIEGDGTLRRYLIPWESIHKLDWVQLGEVLISQSKYTFFIRFGIGVKNPHIFLLFRLMDISKNQFRDYIRQYKPELL